MPPRYAEKTRVPVSKTKADIEALIAKYGGTNFATANDDARDCSMVAFHLSGRRFQIVLPLPRLDEFAVTPGNIRRNQESQQTAWEQACRSRWRSLLLYIHTKLDSVETGIASAESEFLAHIVLPDGRTVGEWLQPQIEEAYATGRQPPMLAAGEDN